jgi:ribonuclease P protein subunit RPR2
LGASKGGCKITKKEKINRQSRKGRKGRRTKEMITLAHERIERLFRLAEDEARDHNLERATRYVKLARKIGMRYNVRLPKKFKLKICRHCLAYIVPDINSRVRIRNGKIVIYCYDCGKFTRLPYYKNTQKGHGSDQVTSEPE